LLSFVVLVPKKKIMPSLLLYLLVALSLGFAAPEKPRPEVCLSAEEYKIYQLLNTYRKQYKLPPIPLSASMTIVAQAHAKDLQENQPAKGKCNLHSWSDKGTWKACCYTDDHAQAKGMWDKPRELSEYKGDGFEISFWQSNGATANLAIEGWKKSVPHNNMMINRDIWKKLTWNACGVGLYGNYAVVWFGREKDPAGEAKKCQ